MRIRFLTAATLATMALLLPNRSQAQPSRPPDRSAAAYHVVDRLLTHRGALALTEYQVHELTTLSGRLREDRGHPQIVGFDRVPGKWVPQIERVRPTPDDARRLALRDLSPEQRREAATVLAAPESAQTAER
jgi:hypothetical protein